MESRFTVGDRVRIDIPDETDPDHDRLHGCQDEITAILEDDTAIVTGPSGAGKTCISQFVTERLREEVLEVETTYVNCWRNAFVSIRN